MTELYTLPFDDAMQINHEQIGRQGAEGVYKLWRGGDKWPVNKAMESW